MKESSKRRITPMLHVAATCRVAAPDASSLAGELDCLQSKAAPHPIASNLDRGALQTDLFITMAHEANTVKGKTECRI